MKDDLRSHYLSALRNNRSAQLTEVCIVVTTSILRIGNNGITSSSAILKVTQLEVTGQLVETKSVDQIVIHVACVEQLSDHKVDVLFRGESIGLSVVIDEGQALVDRSIVEQIVILSFPVLVSDDVVTDCGVESSGVLGHVHSGQMLTSPRVVMSRNLMPSPRRGNLVPWLSNDGEITSRGIVDTWNVSFHIFHG